MNGRIMIVEDDAALRLTLERHLGDQGLRPLAVDSAEAALTQFATFRPHAVLLDIRLPGMTGLELLLKLRDAAEEVAVILITGYADMAGAVEAMKWGAFDYLVKPLDLDVIDRTLARCLQLCRNRHTPPEGVLAPPPEAPDPVLVGSDPKMVEVYKLIGKVATVPTPVLLRGETGTGKEVIARLIHANSAFAKGPFVPVNCAGERKGRFERAGCGTIFLDEIGDLSAAVQVKLLRVLQDGVLEARIIAATHQPLERLVAEGKFRDDLYFRLRVVEIVVPPLRQRRDDIRHLVAHILGRVCRQTGRAVPAVPDRVMDLLRTYDWPGNVRELENALTRAAVLAQGVIEPEHLALGLSTESPPGGDPSLGAVERQHVRRILLKAGGSKTKAAAMLGISRPRLNRLLDKHRIAVS